MEMLVRDLLAYTQVTRLDAPPEVSDASAVLRAVLPGLANSISASKGEITAGELPNVPVHSVHLSQLFQNLIGNALKYRGTKVPVVHVEASRHGSDWLRDCTRETSIRAPASALRSVNES